jgi:pimeloyl-ACP methyl ester carboxylesterase
MAALTTAGHNILEGRDPLMSAIVLVDIAPKVERSGSDKIIAFMSARPDGFATLEEAADVIAEYLPHRPRPTDLSGLQKNLRLQADGRYRWHWDPAWIVDVESRRAVNHEDDLDRYARVLNIPTLLVRGRQSDLLSEEGARHFLDLVPHAEYVDVAGAGHMVAGDRNDAFTSGVVEFLQRRHVGR